MVNVLQVLLMLIIGALTVGFGFVMHMFFGLVGVALYGVLTAAIVGVVYVISGGVGGDSGGPARPGRQSKGRSGPSRRER